MAGNSNVSKALTIVWTTKRAFKGKRKFSSSFSLMGELWRLMMESDEFEYAYNHGLGCVRSCYTINLMQGGHKTRPLPFSLTTFIETEAGKNFCPSRGLLTTYDSRFGPIWSYSMDFVTEKIPGFKDDEELTVVCVFRDLNSSMCRIPDEMTPVARVRSQCDNLENLSQDFGSLLSNERFPSDMVVSCGDRTTPAHRAVLAARSEVFAAMFRNKMAESESGLVEIVDMDMPDFELFLKFVYSGKVKFPSMDSAASLYSAGDKYAIPSLKKACSSYMLRNLTAKNCLRFMELSEKHSDEVFQGAVLNFVADNLAYLQREEWATFSAECPTLAVRVYERRFASTLSQQVSGRKSRSTVNIFFMSKE